MAIIIIAKYLKRPSTVFVPSFPSLPRSRPASAVGEAYMYVAQSCCALVIIIIVSPLEDGRRKHLVLLDCLSNVLGGRRLVCRRV